jgi:LuxR family glucitol operon transcriptional activator
VVSFSSIRLDELSKDESFQLIDRKAKSKGVSFTVYQKERIYRRFGGIPAALIYAVGRRAMGYSLKAILGLSQPLSELPHDSVKLSFESSVIPLRKQPTHKLLLSLVIFQDAPTKDAIALVSGLQNDTISIEEGLLQLQTLFLVQKKDERYYTLATTREYILVELAKYPEFEEEARGRWIEWYLKFTQKYGGKDWQKWREQYDRLDRERENIFSVLYWCSSQDLYQEAQSLWQNIDSYVDLDGHWHTRRYWWKWLIKESDRRADLPTYVQALSERAWTLTLMGKNNLSEAAHEFAKALKLNEYADLEVQSRLFCHIAVHRLIKKRYNQAFDWLERAENYLNEADLDERELTREQVYIKYHKAEVIYWTRLGRLGRSQAEKSRIGHDYSSKIKSGKLRREISLNQNASSSWYPRNSSTVPQKISERILQRSRVGC